MSADILRDLVQRHGGDLHGSYAVLPGPGHSRRDRSLSVTIGHGGRPVFHSFAGDPFELVRDYLGLDAKAGSKPMDPRLLKKISHARERERQADDARKLTFCETVWRECQPAAQSPVDTYLHQARGIPGPIPAVIRFHPAAPLDYEGRRCSPAMVAIVQDKDGYSCGLHVTALMPDGSGKAGDNARRMFGPVNGGAVRLSTVHDDLAVAEGVETALSFAALTGRPTWSCLSTAGLKAFERPSGIRTLTIAADGDDAGIDAATDLAARAHQHCDVIISPAPGGMDWNDCLKGKAQ